MISRMSNERWSVCLGGSNDGSWSLNGNVSRYWSMIAVMSSPSSGTGKSKNGPLTVLQFENVAWSWYTAIASSYPLIITTSRFGSRHTGLCSRSQS